MKFILILLLTSTAVRAQVPHINYMIADEAKSQLQIHGTFGPDTTGFVTIENTKQKVRSLSDTMLICDLPDSGAGSGGHVIVQQMSGTSNARMLSIFKMTINHNLTATLGQTGGYHYMKAGYCDWIIQWRADFLTRRGQLIEQIPFDVSKISFGKLVVQYTPPFTDATLPWSDSTSSVDSAVSVKGYLDIVKYQIVFKTLTSRLKSLNYNTGVLTPLAITAPIIDFDTIGNIKDYTYSDNNYYIYYDFVSDQKILFPPSIKNAVTQSPQPTSDIIKIFSHIGSEDHQISFEAEEPLGETTASLYSIDGRLLKQEKIYIPSARMYSFDASGVSVRFGILVFKTDKGIFARKVLF